MRALNTYICLLGICLLFTAARAHGEASLAWKLKPGESLHVAIEQKTDSQIAFSGKAAKTTIELTLVLGWNVLSADDSGFKIRQTVERIRQKLSTQQAGTIEFDSASSSRQTGPAADLATSLRPLVGVSFDLTMSPRGEITVAEPSNEPAKALLAALETAAAGDPAARGAVEQLLRRPLLVLPEKPVNQNDTWSTTAERNTAAGPLKIDTTYELQSLSDQGGKQVASIAMSAKVAPSSGGGLKVTDSQHSGEIDFSLSDGRVIRIDQTQKLTTERPYRDTTIIVTLTSTQKTTMATR